MSITQPSAVAGSVTSADGTTIGYRRTGDGPGVVLLHGGGQSSQNLMSLAAALSDRFTVYVPGRRGRGMSGPYREDHGARKEVEDLDALLDRTRAHNVFGLSVGALIAIEAARTLPAITRLALYEPPLEFDGITQTAWLPRYERELAGGHPGAALVTIMRALPTGRPSASCHASCSPAHSATSCARPRAGPSRPGWFLPATSSPRCTTTHRRS
jgi:pimeloyl-ACP methyl ester carboxylesterase